MASSAAPSPSQDRSSATSTVASIAATTPIATNPTCIPTASKPAPTSSYPRWRTPSPSKSPYPASSTPSPPSALPRSVPMPSSRASISPRPMPAACADFVTPRRSSTTLTRSPARPSRKAAPTLLRLAAPAKSTTLSNPARNPNSSRLPFPPNLNRRSSLFPPTRQHPRANRRIWPPSSPSAPLPLPPTTDHQSLTPRPSRPPRTSTPEPRTWNTINKTPAIALPNVQRTTNTTH